MREESHLDEMRSAIRGDFERLAERRGEQELMRVDARPQASAPELEEPELAEPVDELGPPRRSWLARLLGL